MPGLAELDPRVSLAAQARVQAAYEADPMNRYDHSHVHVDDNLASMLASMPYKGGGKAARRGKYSALAAGLSPTLK